MEAIDIPADRVPEGLKACEQILKRAKEVKKVEPVVAYWCESFEESLNHECSADNPGCFSAAQKALKIKERSKGETMFLMSLLDALEEVSAPSLGRCCS
jgi:vacuolar protein sorting-associated protein VTA1